MQKNKQEPMQPKVRPAFAITVGLPPSMTATQLFVVPRSIPTTFPMSKELRSFSFYKHILVSETTLRRGVVPEQTPIYIELTRG